MRFLAGITAFPTGEWVIPAYGVWLGGLVVLMASIARLAKPFTQTRKLSLTPRAVGLLGARAGLVAMGGLVARAAASQWVTISLDGERTVVSGFSTLPLARTLATLSLISVATASAAAADRPLLRVTSARAMSTLTSPTVRLALVALALIDIISAQPPAPVLVLALAVAAVILAFSRRAIVDRKARPLMIGARDADVAKCESDPGLETHAEFETQAEFEADFEAGPAAETEAVTEIEADVEAETEAETEAEPEAGAGADTAAEPEAADNSERELQLVGGPSQSLVVFQGPTESPKRALQLPTNAVGRRTEIYATGVAMLAALALFVGLPSAGSSSQAAGPASSPVTNQSPATNQSLAADTSARPTQSPISATPADTETDTKPGAAGSEPASSKTVSTLSNAAPSTEPNALGLTVESSAPETAKVAATAEESPTPTTSLLNVPPSLKDKMPDVDGPALDNAKISSMCAAVEPAHRVCFRRAMIAVLRNKGMDATLTQFKELLRTDKAAEDDCHITVHEMGREALALADGNLTKVTNLEDPICSSGIIHGAIIAKLELVPRDNLAVEVPKLCALDPVDGPSGAEFASCIHGLGHALLLMTEDFYGSLKLCDSFAELQKINRADQPDLRGQCGQGVYMQNNLMFREGLPGVTKISDPMFPCDVAKDYMKKGCYAELAAHYYLTRNIADPRQVGPEICEKVPEDYTYACYQGLVTVIATQNWDSPEATAEFCNSIPSAVGKISCAQSGASRYATIRIERDAVDTFCAAQPEPNKTSCNTTRDERLAQADAQEKKSKAHSASA